MNLQVAVVAGQFCFVAGVSISPYQMTRCRSRDKLAQRGTPAGFRFAQHAAPVSAFPGVHSKLYVRVLFPSTSAADDACCPTLAPASSVSKTTPLPVLSSAVAFSAYPPPPFMHPPTLPLSRSPSSTYYIPQEVPVDVAQDMHRISAARTTPPFSSHGG